MGLMKKSVKSLDKGEEAIAYLKRKFPKNAKDRFFSTH